MPDNAHSFVNFVPLCEKNINFRNTVPFFTAKGAKKKRPIFPRLRSKRGTLQQIIQRNRHAAARDFRTLTLSRLLKTFLTHLLTQYRRIVPSETQLRVRSISAQKTKSLCPMLVVVKENILLFPLNQRDDLNVSSHSIQTGIGG